MGAIRINISTAESVSAIETDMGITCIIKLPVSHMQKPYICSQIMKWILEVFEFICFFKYINFHGQWNYIPFFTAKWHINIYFAFYM